MDPFRARLIRSMSGPVRRSTERREQRVRALWSPAMVEVEAMIATRERARQVALRADDMTAEQRAAVLGR